jgi:hypothetical protein
VAQVRFHRIEGQVQISRTFTTITATAIAALIIALNIYLLYDTLVA